MRRKVYAAFLAIFVLGLVRAEDRRIDKTRLVVMTFNTYFMWDGVSPEEGQVQFPWKGSQVEADEHMQKIAEVIIRNDPDVVTLVEVEGLAALNRLNDNFLAGRGYEVSFIKGKDTFTNFRNFRHRVTTLHFGNFESS